MTRNDNGLRERAAIRTWLAAWIENVSRLDPENLVRSSAVVSRTSTRAGRDERNRRGDPVPAVGAGEERWKDVETGEPAQAGREA